MKKLVVGLLMLLFLAMILLVLANDTPNGEHEEDTSIGHQFEEILPFHHFAEGHVFAGIMLIIFWASFFYMLYSVFQILRKKGRK